jgi:hypothetical protein
MSATSWMRGCIPFDGRVQIAQHVVQSATSCHFEFECIYIRINNAAPALMCLSACQNSSNFVIG